MSRTDHMEGSADRKEEDETEKQRDEEPVPRDSCRDLNDVRHCTTAGHVSHTLAILTLFTGFRRILLHHQADIPIVVNSCNKRARNDCLNDDVPYEFTSVIPDRWLNRYRRFSRNLTSSLSQSLH